eukprot:7519515-Pyramimonas_sp.AAC.1
MASRERSTRNQRMGVGPPRGPPRSQDAAQAIPVAPPRPGHIPCVFIHAAKIVRCNAFPRPRGPCSPRGRGSLRVASPAGPKRGPRLTQGGNERLPSSPNMNPLWPKIAPMWGQDGPTCLLDGSKWRQGASRGHRCSPRGLHEALLVAQRNENHRFRGGA